MTHSAII